MQELIDAFAFITLTVRFLNEWWSVLFLAVPAFFVCLFLLSWLGPRFSWPAWAAGIAVVFLKVGEKLERDRQEKIQKDILQKSKDGYKKIPAAPLRDFFDRLRKR